MVVGSTLNWMAFYWLKVWALMVLSLLQKLD